MDQNSPVRVPSLADPPALGAAPFTSYAQNFEDVMLRRALRDVRAGCYLDVGAGEPDADSVTQAFYELGWHGVNVEPLPGPFARLQAARPRDVNLNLAAGAAPGEACLYVVGDETGLSTLDPVLAEQHRAAGWGVRTARVPVATLAQICAAHVEGDLHFLKVDAEGAELDVLRGADFTRWRPWIVLLEAVDPVERLPQHEGWETEVLAPAGYDCVWFDGLNRFYLAAEHKARLAGAFRAPPNVFDSFVRGTEVGLKGQLEAARTAARVAEAHAHAAQERADEAQARVHAAQTRVDEEQARVAAAEARADDAQAHARAAQVLAGHLQARAEEVQVRLSDAEAARDRAAAQAAEAEARVASLRDDLERAVGERDGWAQELFESDRHAAELVLERQKLLEDQARLHADEALRAADVAARRDREEHLLAEVASLRGHEEGLLAEVAWLRDKEERLRQELAGLAAERDKALAEVADGAFWLRAVRESRSWRVTRPVRVLGRLLGLERGR